MTPEPKSPEMIANSVLLQWFDATLEDHGVAPSTSQIDRKLFVEVVSKAITSERERAKVLLEAIQMDLTICVRDFGLGFPVNPNAPMHLRFEKHIDAIKKYKGEL